MDLEERLRSRGFAARLSSLSDVGIVFILSGPRQLRPEEGSCLVQKQMGAFASTVLGGRTVAELKEVCRMKGLPSHGAKEELLRRLVEEARRTSKTAAAPIDGAGSPSSSSSSPRGVCTPEPLRRRRSSVSPAAVSFCLPAEEAEEPPAQPRAVSGDKQPCKRRRLSVKGPGPVKK
mmetsp:Transcript_72231/g.207308  ORF Transcript_72231/g.207308 Transcript_72231/m.207308 type:complete len:176 (+) Transcript_72231:65-592(+)